MPEILHRVVLGNTWPSRAANPSTHQRGTAHSPSHQGGGASQTRAVHHALQGDARRVLPAPRRRSWETDATPSARNSGSIACQRFCIGCLGTVGGSLTVNPLGGWLPPDPSPAVHLRGGGETPPYCASRSSTGGASGRDTARCSRATRLALVALTVRLTRPPQLSFLSSSYCSHRRRDDICPTSCLHGTSNGRCLNVRVSPLPICAPSSWVLH